MARTELLYNYSADFTGRASGESKKHPEPLNIQAENARRAGHAPVHSKP